MINILVIDDDPDVSKFLATVLDTMGADHSIAHSFFQALSLITTQTYDLVLLDLELPDGNGLDLIPEIAHSPDSPEIIIITGSHDVEGARLAFKYGAWDYIQKPFLLDEVTLPITRALQYRKEKKANYQPVRMSRKNIIGKSDVIEKCLNEAGKAAATDVSVLITGETGTGKELFARAIHESSPRKAAPFIAVDCGALPETLVENTLFGHEKGAYTGAQTRQAGLILQADKGTLMLDEVGNLPLFAQKSLLRTLQEKSVRPVGGSKEIPLDIRLLAATNLDLDQMVKQNTFREDLLFRIRAMEIKLPPLRERDDDIAQIAIIKINELTDRYHMSHKILSPEFLSELNRYPWPGNVRELINVLEFALASAGSDPTLFPKHMPPEYRISGIKFDACQTNDTDSSVHHCLEEAKPLPSLNSFRNRMEKSYLIKLRKQAKGYKDACQISGMSRSRLYGLLDKHRLPRFK